MVVRLCDINACMVKVAGIATAESREARTISTERANFISDLEGQVDKMQTFIAHLHRQYENRHDIVLPGKAVTDTVFEKNLSMCFQPLDGVAHLDSFDKVPLSAWRRVSLATATEWLDGLTKQWNEDLEFLSKRVEKACPDWSSVKEDLVKIPQAAMVRTLLLNPEYKIMADLCAKINSIISAAKFSRAVAIFPAELVKTAEANAKLGNLTVSLTYVLYHWWIAIPKLKGCKLKAGEAVRLKLQLTTKGVFKQLPDTMRNAIDETIDQCQDAKATFNKESEAAATADKENKESEAAAAATADKESEAAAGAAAYDFTAFS